MTKKHNVHVYVTCRIEVSGIEAVNPQAAAQKARDILQRITPKRQQVINVIYPWNQNEGFPDVAPPGVMICDAGYADEINAYTVDVLGDKGIEQTVHYDDL